MKTRVLTPPIRTTQNDVLPIEDIQKEVDERGFSLYEWISPDELRTSVQADYLSIVKKASIPLAVITFIFGVIGFAGGPLGVIAAILFILGVFYTFVFLYLILKMIRRSYLYTRGADVIITDHHYVSGGRIIERDDTEGVKKTFETMGELFREPLFEPSRLKEYIALERKGLFDQLKDIAYGGGKIIEKVGRSRDAGGIVLVVIIGGLLFGGMMALVYFLGVFFVAIGARIFAWMAHHILLATNNLEHRIQTLFSDISLISTDLQEKKLASISLLTEAGRNEWKENLSAKIEDSFALINERAKKATEKSIELEKLLSSSKYRDIFNFVKYGGWIKTQILEPLDEIYSLLSNNKNTLQSILSSLDSQILETTTTSLKKPLELQKERLTIQVESFDRIIEMIDGYREKLKIN